MKEKDATGIGGSSMGGIMAFYAYIYRPDVFGYSLSFSPAFFFYHKRNWFKILDKYDINPEKNGKLFLYVGGKDFEKVFVKRTLETFHYLEDRGFDQENLGLIFDSREPHHEKAWAKYLPEALKLWLK
jgi:predicted alpha/beta superfamily hydrolase